jgi:DNA-binding NarL/FixJ family response regulator
MTALYTSNTKPVMIYFRSPSDDDVTKCDPTVVQDYNNVLPVHVVTCDSWTELNVLLLKGPGHISINTNVFTSTDVATIKETVSMLQTALKLACLDIPIVIVVENDTLQHVVLEAKKLGLQGLIPYHGDWDPVDIMSALAALTNRVVHWPQHIIDQLPTGPLPTGPKQHSTPRQDEVGDMIAHRGVSNKQIARTLNISESAVKKHISKLFKKHSVTSRSQLTRTLLQDH